MLGLMMDSPLTITSILRFAERNHPNSEIVSITLDQPLHRCTYAEAFKRARRLANAMKKLGIEHADRIGTMAWNDFRHFELYYAVSCSGAVCHTINPRLFPEQIVYIINHADDRWLFIDPTLVPVIEAVAGKFRGVEGFIVMTDEAHMPETTLPNVKCYETLLAVESDDFHWPSLDENAASSMCYTSGTTGNPKGVLYSHRSTVIHSYACCMADVMGLSLRDSVLPVVPMFHANAWGIPYAAPIAGSKLIFPGPKMADGETLHDLIEKEEVTLALGVPTVWLALLAYLADNGKTVSSLERTIVGGAACPLSVMREFKDKHGVDTLHAWGMTEMSPLGTLNTPKPHTDEMTREDKEALLVKQGHGVFGVEMKITDDNNKELPWDGKSSGSLKVRGPWVCSDYYRHELDEGALDGNGWFDTGDVATIDRDGYMQITDRTKDVIKSVGEWISSIELENTAVGHPSVAEAAVIGVPHDKWTERPLLVVVQVPEGKLTRGEMLAWFDGKVAKWWIPDDVVFVTDLPHTATGKILKTTLRDQFKDHELPEVAG